MKSVPLISVVLPTYNVALYIKESIYSILNQSIQDFEIIIIDDCSTDNTIAIVESLKDSRIRIIKKAKNKGLIDSLNIGFKEANGQFIARMDGDDINDPYRFEKQLKILQKNSEIKACGCWLQCFGSSNEVIKHKEFHNEIVAQMLLSCPMSMGSVMFDRGAVSEFRFDESKLHVEDYDFWSRVAWSFKLYNIQEVLYHYRVHDSQVSTIYKSIQANKDIDIKLFLFKKLKYDIKIYSDELITKMLLLNEYIEAKEIKLFVNWLSVLKLLNIKHQIFSQDELTIVLQNILRTIVFHLYFKKSTIGIDRNWRLQTFFKLPLKEMLFVLKLKSKEIKKLLNK